jgi:hypothetical protein
MVVVKLTEPNTIEEKINSDVWSSKYYYLGLRGDSL